MKRFSASINNWLTLFAVFVLPACCAVAANFKPPDHRFLIGPASGSDAAVWVQSDGEALVRLELLDQSSGQWQQADVALTRPDESFTAELGAEELEPGQEHVARLRVTGEVVDPLFALRTAPISRLEGNFSIAVVSGANSVASGLTADQIGRLLDLNKPTATVWLGGLSRLDENRWSSLRGYESAHAQVRRDPLFQPLFVRTQNLATWGQVDYGPPGAGHSLWSRYLAREAFDRYWPTPLGDMENRPFGVGGWSWRWGDVEIFFLDSHWRRSGNADQVNHSIIGQEQWDWLLDAIEISRARFHILAMGEPLLASDSVAAQAEMDYLQKQLRKRSLPGLVILAGAPAYPGELSLALDKRPPIYELTVSGFRDTQFDEETFLNYLRTPGTLVRQPHIAFLHFSGINKHRSVRMSVHDLGTGEEIWALTLTLQELAPHTSEQ